MTFDPNANYCTLAPDKLFGVSFKKACYYHDRQYRNEVKERLTRKEADEELYHNILITYGQKGKWKTGFIVGKAYYYGCRFMGLFTWKK